ncbi:MAG: hypothetical protein II140_03595, partial [Paludibacteraceae bacterium]|nr:hypothetical protein [Paludibacteraceae bacterium]
WKKLMQSDAPNRVKQVAVGMSLNERVRFAEKCSRVADVAMQVASAEQIVAAEQQGLIEPFQADNTQQHKQQSVRQIQRKRRAADKWSPLTELVGFKLPKPDDPILLQYKQADDESRPLRLVISDF